MEVLCIEDEKITSRLIERMIEKAYTPDIIITDIFLPDGKGTEIILEMPKIPVIAMPVKNGEAEYILGAGI